MSLSSTTVAAGADVQPGASPGWRLNGRGRRLLLWGALLSLLGVAQTLLLVMTLQHESARVQEDTDTAAQEAASALRRSLTSALQGLQRLALLPTDSPTRHATARETLRLASGLLRVEWRDNLLSVTDAVDSSLMATTMAPQFFSPGLFARMPRADLEVEAQLACTAARRVAAPMFSRSYFVPLPGGHGSEVIDLCIPVQHAGQDAGYVVGSFGLKQALETSLGDLDPRETRHHAYTIVEGDGARLASTGVQRGAGAYLSERVVDLPGTTLQLRADSARGRPSLIPNLATALVLGLSLALFAVVLLLARDVRRRALAERALAEALAFRKAMEDSLSTGLRARDLEGVVTYANPAFCAMVGFTQEELGAARDAQPYWPPESAQEYQMRQVQRKTGTGGRATAELRAGFETLFMRKNGERFPVMIYEAPLVDGDGKHKGWMSAVLDLSAQRQVEDISRQQQERLQATARLTTVGEMASLLSHELNQPLSAIASYASGSLNLVEQPDEQTPALIKQALQRIAEQAERAGRVIKSVHDFVRRREHQHEVVAASTLIDAVLPLVRLQARKSGTRIEVETLPAPLAGSRAPRVRCDRTMIEQVLLNLSRNGIQAMEEHTPVGQRMLTLRIQQTHEREVAFSLIDAGPGIPQEVATRLFTPFFTTRAEGMGLGLSLCRTVIEQHGGTLDYRPGPGGCGTEFRFTLPSPALLEGSDTAAFRATA